MTLNNEKKGLVAGILCYLIWGLFPIYWYPLLNEAIEADQLLAQRIIWSSLFAFLLMLQQKQLNVFLNAIRQPKIILIFFCSALVLSINWLTYLWGITNDRVLDASLGYFLSPLANVAFGRLIFKEQLTPLQWIAVMLAAIGVLWLALNGEHFPWVAIGISMSWGVYSVFRKKVTLPVIPGLTLETLILLPFGILYLLWKHNQNEYVFSELPLIPLSLIIGSGIITTIPLLLFAFAARNISLINLGMMQYFAPTLIFLCGLIVFNESFDFIRFIGYLWVWIGVILFIISSLRQYKKA